MKLLCLDMDGVLLENGNFWMKVHEAFGTLEEGRVLTDAYLDSDYPRLVEEVVGRLWKGRGAGPYLRLIQELQLMDGTQEFFAFVHARGWKTAIISGGSLRAAQRLQERFSIDFIHANELVIVDDVVTGDFDWPVGYAREHKADILVDMRQELGLDKEDCAYVGDTDADLEAFAEVGLSIAFNCASERLKEAADAIVDGSDLRDVIPVLERWD